MYLIIPISALSSSVSSIVALPRASITKWSIALTTTLSVASIIALTCIVVTVAGTERGLPEVSSFTTCTTELIIGLAVALIMVSTAMFTVGRVTLVSLTVRLSLVLSTTTTSTSSAALGLVHLRFTIVFTE